jgi:hypothetical protein
MASNLRKQSVNIFRTAENLLATSEWYALFSVLTVASNKMGI